MLKDWTIRISLTVRDEGASGSGWWGGSFGGHGDGTNSPGFPPLFVYRLDENPGVGDVVLTKGPHPIGYRKQQTRSSGWIAVDRDRYREDYLEFMAGRFPMKSVLINCDVERTTDAAFRLAAEAFGERVRFSVDELKGALVARQKLTVEEEREAYPALEVRVVDQRRNPVPRLTDVSFSIR